MAVINQSQPRLFGVTNSNRDFSDPKTWGKNQFNSSFPTALACYLAFKQVPAVYLQSEDSQIIPGEISIEEVFQLPYDSTDLFFAFESQHTPYQQYVLGNLPRTDLVTQNRSEGTCLAGLEIKLTALPDNTTCECTDEADYGSEIVVRPDTIVYLACSAISALGESLTDLIPNLGISDWSLSADVMDFLPDILNAISNVAVGLSEHQSPFLLQPVWKTQGKSPQLADQCLDVFCWSDAAFIQFIHHIASASNGSLTRQERTAVWLFKMLEDYKNHGRFNANNIINDLTYDTKNDKAFASSGIVTNPLMSCDRLSHLTVSKSEIREIILGGGQNLLSPERRFDAIIYNSPELFII